MRITQSMIARMGIDQLNAQRGRLQRTQEMAVTGLRINRPSDDPNDYRKATLLKDSLAQTDRFMRTIDVARSRLQQTENALDGTAQALTDARVEALSALNVTNFDTPSTREAIKSRVQGVFEQVLAYANERSPSGAYLFSGRDSDTPAFTATGSFGPGSVPTVAFTGDAYVVELEIDENVFVDVGRDGQNAFQGAADVFSTLTDLWTAVDQGDRAGIESAITRIDAAFEHVVLERAEVGGAEAKVNAFEDRLQVQDEELKIQISNLEDADAFEVYSDLAKQETALQASLQVNARLLQPTLLDYI